MKHRLITALCLIAVSTAGIRAGDFVEFGKPDRFIDIDAHVFAGGTYVTNNYPSSYPTISNINSTMGVGFGAGAGVRCSVRKWLAVGTEFNILHGSGKIDLVVVGESSSSVSNIFMENNYWTANIPVFVTFRFNPSHNVKWEVDGGIYFGYGLGGTQSTVIYNAKINELGQLLTSSNKIKAKYYHDLDGFINSIDRFDNGLHVATRLVFRNRFNIGVRTDIGWRNASHSIGIIRPTCHNISLLAVAGWRF